MRISHIAQLLKKRFENITIGIQEDRLIVGVEPYSKEYPVEWKADILYITRQEDSCIDDSRMQDLCMLILHSEHESVDDNHRNVIRIQTKCPDKEVLNYVRQILEQDAIENAVSADLYSCLNMDDFIETLIDKAYGYLQNPLTYYDHLHNVKSFRMPEMTENAAWKKDIELGHIDYDNLSDTYYLCLESLIGTGEIEFELLGQRCRAITITKKKKLLGFLVALETTRPFTAQDSRILHTVSEIIALNSTGDYSNDQSKESLCSILISNLLDTCITTETELKGLMKTRNWKQKPYYRVLLFQASDQESDIYLNYVTSRLTGIIGVVSTLLYPPYIVALIETDTPNQEPLLNRIEKNFQKTQLTIGISDICNNLLQLHKYFNQAAKALAYNDICTCGRTVNYHTDYKMLDFLIQSHKNLDAEMYYHPFITALDQYDENHNTELGKTLHIYLEQEKSVLQTSELLHVHKNTVNYRIHKIKELLDSDLNDPSENFHLLLSYKLKNAVVWTSQ